MEVFFFMAMMCPPILPGYAARVGNYLFVCTSTTLDSD
jgi:hypothetical protein